MIDVICGANMQIQDGEMAQSISSCWAKAGLDSGYRGGIERKRALLAKEAKSEAVSARGAWWRGSLR